MTPVFLHGWGYDASLWDGVRARTGGVALDRGYFGAREDRLPDGPLLLVGHSLGALLWLARPPVQARALVAVNGFDRFAAAPDWPGVATRVLARMTARFAEAPGAVLAEFRARVGGVPPPETFDTTRLGADLALLADADARDASAAFAGPVLALDGDADPLLPAGLRERAFEWAPGRVRRTRAGGGHLLPLTDPDWCADAIMGLLA